MHETNRNWLKVLLPALIPVVDIRCMEGIIVGYALLNPLTISRLSGSAFVVLKTTKRTAVRL
jgi:hypothetical protein